MSATDSPELSQADLAGILAGVGDAVTVQDPSGRLVYANAAAARLIGFPSPARLLATPPADVLRRFTLLTADGRPFPLADLPGRLVLQGRPGGEVVVRFRVAATGEERWSLVSAAPLHDAHGRVRFAVNLFRDVTERERMARLLAVTAALAEAATREAVAQAALREGLAAVGAVAGGLGVLTADGLSLERLALAGYPAEIVEGTRHAPLEALGPIADTARTGAAIWLETNAQLFARYPRLDAIPARRRYGAAVSVPLAVGGRTIGVLSLRFAEERPFDAAARDLILAIAGQCAQALERARLYDEERRARAEAEGVRGELARQAARAEALADASRAFAEASLELEPVLDTVARRVVAALGDTCLIRLLSDDGQWLEPVARYHPDPAARAFAAALHAAAPERADEGLNGRVMQTGVALLIPVVDQEALRAAIKPEYAAYLDRFGTHSIVIVPLRVRGRAFGVLSVARETPGRPYTAGDQGFLQELADRAAPAIENARLYRQAREAIRLREQFASIASHELRTPLTTVQGYLELLERQFARRPPPEERVGRYLAALRDQVGRLALLVGDLLDASRIQQGRLSLRLERCDLAALAREVAEQCRQAPEHTPRHRLTVEAPAPVAGTWDRDRLAQVLINLVSNALKYSPGGGAVRVRVAGRAEDEAEVVVSDAGLGIPPEEQAGLFQPFVRASTVAERIGGTGLGLYIVRQIVEAHGGTVALASAPGRGTTITVRLPRTGADSRTATAARPGGAGA